MHVNQLSRRKFLLLTAAGLYVIPLANCSSNFSTATSKSAPVPQPSNTLLPPPSDSVIPARLGINIHFTQPHQNDIPMIASAGFGFVRMDFPWADIERQKGLYDFSVQNRLTQSFAKQRINTLGIISYGNRIYDNSTAPFHLGPQTDEVRSAFARFAASAAATFKERGVMWEIWNEPNNPIFWQPNPNADEYVKLAKETITAMRQVDPNVTIIAPAVITLEQENLNGWNYLERCFALGLLELVDAISIHPYRRQPPETAENDYQHLQTLIAHYMPPRKKMFPIISSEWGYPVTAQVSKELQAALLARQFLTNITRGISLSIWYDWQNDGQDPQNPENNFGLLDTNYQPKPAYFAMQTLTKELNGFRFVERLSLSSKDDFALVFTDGNTKKLVSWTTATPHQVQFTTNTQSPITIVNMTGTERPVLFGGTSLTTELTGSPEYLIGLKEVKAL